MGTLLTFCALAAVVSLLHTLALLAAGVWSGAGVEEYGLLMGPRLCRLRLAGLSTCARSAWGSLRGSVQKAVRPRGVKHRAPKSAFKPGRWRAEGGDAARR
jgi:hypothetical protein